MSGQVKVRLRSGAREIEVEASSREDVDALLSRWWAPPTTEEQVLESGENGLGGAPIEAEWRHFILLDKRK
jgi:hypothetical protein